ncbi:MAG: acyltransferase [Candidatus Aminicenantes bacterium]|nr:acyltransferase [Candidatus Aminicenantes bacterium]
MEEDYRGSVQKELIAEKRSFYAKYTALVLGKKGLFSFLKYELVVLLFSGIPGALGLFLRKIFYPVLFKKVGKGVVFGRHMTLRHPKKIVVGDNTVIDDNVVLDAKGEENEGIRIGANAYIGRNTVMSCKEGSIFLDDYCNISANCLLLSETEIRMGKYCFLAGQCYLVAGGNHSFEKLSVPIMFQPSYSKGGINIGEDVWLGAGVIVLDGAAIGKGTIVGAGSVVTHSLPEYSIAVGTPAKKTKDRKAIV